MVVDARYRKITPQPRHQCRCPHRTPLLFVVTVVTFALIMRLVVSILVERVLDVFAENLFGAVWSIMPFCQRMA